MGFCVKKVVKLHDIRLLELSVQLNFIHDFIFGPLVLKTRFEYNFSTPLHFSLSVHEYVARSNGTLPEQFSLLPQSNAVVSIGQLDILFNDLKLLSF